MTQKNFMAVIVSTTLLFVLAFGTLNCGGGGTFPYNELNEDTPTQDTPTQDTPTQTGSETARYLEQNISTDSKPETLKKGSTSIISKTYLLELTDENAPAFQEAFARGAIFTLTYPTQSDIDKLREVLSLEPQQVIPEDAKDPHAEIYAITSRNNGGGMSTYEYVADASANVITEVNSDDAEQEVSGDSVVPAFFAAESDDALIMSADVAKRRAENFLEWSRSIDSLFEENMQSAEVMKAQIAASAGVALTEYGMTVNSTAHESSNSYLTMTPRLDMTTIHSFSDSYDYYCLRIGGKFTPNYVNRFGYQYGYATRYYMDAWLENGIDDGIELLSTWPTTPNKEKTVSTQFLLNLGGEIGVNTTSEGEGKLSTGVSWGKTTTVTTSDYDILDNSNYGVAQWEYQFEPVNFWSNPSPAARSTLQLDKKGQDLKAVWRVSPSYWSNKGKNKLKLNYYYEGWNSDRNRHNFNQYWVSLENVGMRNNEATNGGKEIIVRAMRNRTGRAREAHIFITGRQTGAQLRIRIIQDA